MMSSDSRSSERASERERELFFFPRISEKPRTVHSCKYRHSLALMLPSSIGFALLANAIIQTTPSMEGKAALCADGSSKKRNFFSLPTAPNSELPTANRSRARDKPTKPVGLCTYCFSPSLGSRAEPTFLFINQSVYFLLFQNMPFFFIWLIRCFISMHLYGFSPSPHSCDLLTLYAN